MGCGSKALNIATGGVSGMIQGDDPIDSVVHAISGGALGSEGVIGGDLGALGTASAASLVSGGVSNIREASKYRSFANQMDVMADPSRVNDKWIRKSGEYLEEVPGGHAARQIAPMVMSTVGGIVGGPVGAAGGYYMGSKVRGDSAKSGMIGAGMAAGGSALGAAASPAANYVAGAVSPYVGATAGSAIGSGVTGAASGAIMGGANAAIQGQDIGQGAGMGAISGGIGGAVNTGVRAYSANNDWGKLATAVAEGAGKAGSRYLSQTAVNSIYGSPEERAREAYAAAIAEARAKAIQQGMMRVNNLPSYEQLLGRSTSASAPVITNSIGSLRSLARS